MPNQSDTSINDSPGGNPDFHDFDAYAKACGIDPDKAALHAEEGRQLLSMICEGKDIRQIEHLTREQMMAGLLWYSMKKAIEKGRGFHKGMFVLDLGDANRNRQVFDFFREDKKKVDPVSAFAKGLVKHKTRKMFKSKYIRRFKEAHSRISSHFNSYSHNPEGQFGINISNFQPPGMEKQEQGLEMIRTALFGMLDDGRFFLKPEDHGIDWADDPTDARKHFVNWGGGKKINTAEVVGRREDGYDEGVLNVLSEAVLKTNHNCSNKLQAIYKTLESQFKLYNIDKDPSAREKLVKMIHKELGALPKMLAILEQEEDNHSYQKLTVVLAEQYGKDDVNLAGKTIPRWMCQYGEEVALFLDEDELSGSLYDYHVQDKEKNIAVRTYLLNNQTSTESKQVEENEDLIKAIINPKATTPSNTQSQSREWLRTNISQSETPKLGEHRAKNARSNIERALKEAEIGAHRPKKT